MAGVPINFAVPGEGAVASYSFTDLATGTGYTSFYFIDCSNSIKMLTPTTFYSKKGYTATPTNTAMDVDFDLLFNKKSVVAGDALIQIPVVLVNNSGGGGTITTTAKAEIFAVAVGGAETSLGSISENLSASVAASDYSNQFLIGKITVAEHAFVKGEKLRVTFTATAMGSNLITMIGHDPKNRTSAFSAQPITTTWITSQSIINIPFKVEL
jgi:hypothetical protein